MEIFPEITNWKLREVVNHIEIIDDDPGEYTHRILKKLKIPTSKDYSSLHRSDTVISWPEMSACFQFFFDKIGIEEEIKEAFEKSELASTQFLIIPYGWQEPVIKIPTKLFFDDWEGFLRSTRYETIIFSEDYKLIMEVSRDYYLHSNFEILHRTSVDLQTLSS